MRHIVGHRRCESKFCGLDEPQLVVILKTGILLHTRQLYDTRESCAFCSRRLKEQLSKRELLSVLVHAIFFESTFRAMPVAGHL